MLWSLLYYAFTTFLLFGASQLILKYKRWKRDGVVKKWKMYSQGGEWFFFKRWAMFFLLGLKRLKERRLKGSTSHLLYNRKLAQRYRSSERPQKLKEGPYAIDSVYFYGSDNQGLSFILRFARRPERAGELWFLIRLPNGRHFEHVGCPDTQVYNCSPDSFQTDGLKIFCEEPMRRWRLIFSGFLRESGHPDSLVPVSLNTCFRGFTNAFDVEEDLSHHLIAEGLAREAWSREFFDRLQNEHDDQEHLEQWGAFSGSLQVEERTFELRLRGYRDHSYGTRNWEQYYRYGAHFGHFQDGSCVSLGSVSLPKTTTHIRYGYYFTPYGGKWPITSHNFNLWERGEAQGPEMQYKIKFVANGRRFVLRMSAERNFLFLVGERPSNRIVERFAKYWLNGVEGCGVSEYCYQDYTSARVARQPSLPLLADRPLSPGDARPLVVSLTDELGRASRLTGGKGAQLALLSSVDGVEVPPGVVVTTEAYRTLVRSSKPLADAVRALRTRRDTEAAGKAVQDLVRASPMPQEIRDAVDAGATAVFGSDFEQQRFAVRSSAVGEDGDEASSAGQMETFLGVQGSELAESVLQCWASQFGATAVNYRRQHGQALDADMAVLVQRMVWADAAGVLFTQHPVTGSANHLSIDASFGLGESVVSAKVDPDTFVVTRFPDQRFEVSERRIGAKQTRLEMRDGGGVEEREAGEEKERSCLTDDQVLRMARLGRLIEKHFGSPRDIEWAISDDRIYFLQARAITTGGLLGEDLIHEFDNSLQYDEEYLTSANIQEMMPGAVTPLTASLFGRSIDVALQCGLISSGLLSEVNTVQRITPMFCNHIFLNISNLGLMSELHILGARLNMMYISLLGRVADRPTLEELEKYNGRSGYLRRLYNLVVNMTLAHLSQRATRKWEQRLEDGYRIVPRYTAAEQLEAIDAKMDDYFRCWRDTVRNSSNSAIGTLTVLRIIGEGSGWNKELFSRVAAILSSCEDVYSADVPMALRRLAAGIADSDEREEFLSMDAESAARWLLSVRSGRAGEEFRRFIYRHGHRCVREAEFREVPWHQQPEKVVAVVRSVIAADAHAGPPRAKMDDDEMMDSLPHNINPIKKWLLRRFIRSARRGVGLREWGKSISIQFSDVFKQAFQRLGLLMEEEGLLPDADLLYFLSYDEVHGLVAAGNAALVAKALRRRQVLPKQMELEFQEMGQGVPSPEGAGEHEVAALMRTEDGLTLSGMPVSHGEVSGRARVVRSLEEAAAIAKGEVLIVPYTDVGWTPYFPLIAGLVTEMGGLLSHGAVVAREYGLPCVVGCKQATATFRSGELVRLNGTRGTIQRIKD